MCNIPFYFYNIDIKHLQNTSETFEICGFSATSPCCLGEWICVGMWSFISAVAGCTLVTSTPAMANWVGGREMCVGGLHPGCRELLASELHARPHRAGQAEVFLDADQASAAPVVEAVAVSLTTGGRRSVATGARVYAASHGARRSCVCGRRRCSCGCGR